MSDLSFSLRADKRLLRERFDPALISALYSNFKDPIQALFELVDNAVDDLIKGKTMIITVRLGRDHIKIVNKGGVGMGLRELDGFFAWGCSSKRGKLGRYGQGGKAAMGYLGQSWEIRSTKLGEDVGYVVKEKNWDDRTGGLKKYIPEIEKTEFIDDGIVQIDIWNLKKKINQKEFHRALGSVYRPLIKSGEAEIICDGEIHPLEFPLEMPEEHFELNLSNGRKTTGWLSFLEKGSKTRGGIRCYAFGRLIIENEFFGQKDPGYKESLDRLTGELYIDLEELPLIMNKSDFDRGSPVWQEIKEKMYERMEPYIQLLLEEKDRGLPTEKEQKAAKYAGKIWADFLHYLQHQQKEGVIPGAPIDYGQKPPEPRGTQERQVDERENREVRQPYQPATPPPLEKIGKRRRTGGFPEPLLHPLPEPIRYQLGEEDGKKVVKINTIFPTYKLRRNQLPLYIWETLALEYAKAEDPDTQTVEEYILEMNELLRDLGTFIREKGVKITG